MIAPIAALIIAFAQPPPPVPPILTPAGEAAAMAWQNGLKAVRDRHAAAGPAKDRAEAVARLAELDRAARGGLKAFEGRALIATAEPRKAAPSGVFTGMGLRGSL